MKTLLAATIGCIALAISTQLFAGCNSCGRAASCENSSSYVTECQCTDPNVIRNQPCMTKEKFCESFGNAGQR